jgi:malate dehydrogenase (oxaloacetate-decarboxylating)
LLDRYRDRLCTFNDDIQGTAAATLGAVYAAIRKTGKRLAEQKVVIVGAGGAGLGVAEELVAGMVRDGAAEAEARRRIYLVDVNGLLHTGMVNLSDVQQRFAHPQEAVAGWESRSVGGIGLRTVLEHVKATILIGVCAQAGAFTEEAVRAMAAGVERPIIFPLSNPTARMEATPADLIRWTGGRALVATGGPFPPVQYEGQTHVISQCNNLYVFPAIGLAVSASGATRVTDGMMLAAAQALGDVSPAVTETGGPLLPHWRSCAPWSPSLALRVAMEAVRDGVAPHVDEETLRLRIEDGAGSRSTSRSLPE